VRQRFDLCEDLVGWEKGVGWKQGFFGIEMRFVGAIASIDLVFGIPEGSLVSERWFGTVGFQNERPTAVSCRGLAGRGEGADRGRRPDREGGSRRKGLRGEPEEVEVQAVRRDEAIKESGHSLGKADRTEVSEVTDEDVPPKLGITASIWSIDMGIISGVCDPAGRSVVCRLSPADPDERTSFVIALSLRAGKKADADAEGIGGRVGAKDVESPKAAEGVERGLFDQRQPREVGEWTLEGLVGCFFDQGEKGRPIEVCDQGAVLVLIVSEDKKDLAVGKARVGGEECFCGIEIGIGAGAFGGIAPKSGVIGEGGFGAVGLEDKGPTTSLCRHVAVHRKRGCDPSGLDQIHARQARTLVAIGADTRGFTVAVFQAVGGGGSIDPLKGRGCRERGDGRIAEPFGADKVCFAIAVGLAEGRAAALLTG